MLGLLGRWSDWADLPNHFIPLWAALTLAGFAAACLEARARRPAMAALVTALMITGLRLAPERPEPMQPSAGRPLTLVTFNAWSGNPRQTDAARLLLASGADVIAVQEPHGLRQAEADIRRAYPHYAGCAPISDCAAVIFSRYPIRRLEVAPRAGGLRSRSEFGYVWAKIETPDGRIVRVASTHLDWPAPPGRQAAQRAVVLAALKRLGGADILTGDFNLTPTSFALRRQDRALAPLTRRTRRIATYPAALPVLGLDHIYAQPSWRTVSVQPLHLAGSDHRAVRIVLARP